MEDEIVLYAVGDVGPNREDPHSMFEHVADVVRQGDISFCQLEPVLSLRGTPLPQARLAARSHPEVARAIKETGFSVVSFATNHCMDWGREAFADTIDALHEQGLHVIGAGQNLEEARRPALLEVRGTNVAFLAYNSILPQGYWAEQDRPGCVPLRAHTLYEQIEHDQPGTPCRIRTFAHRDDLNGMIADIRSAKARAELVILSIHWGIHFVPAVLAEYQREIAHAAIDAGADLILGHHTHILKGIEVYKGKVIFYSLANFAMDSPMRFAKDLANRPSHKEIEALNPDWKPGKPWPTDTLKTITVKCLLEGNRIKQVSFLPTYINENDQPEVLRAGDARFAAVIEYMKEISLSQGLDPRFTVQGDEAIVVGAGQEVLA